MRLVTIGQALLVVAILLGFANIAEPHAATSAATTVFTFVAFAIIVWRSHDAWDAGYRDAQLDLSIIKQDRSREMRTGSMLFKCGESGCACANDPRYVVSK